MSKNIVIICYKYPPEYSGFGRQLKSVISEMEVKKCNFKITLLTAYESSKEEKSELLNVVALGTKMNKKHSVVFYIFCLKTLLWLIVHQKNYSVIHCIKAGPEAVIANIISKAFKKKLIVKVVQEEFSDKEISDVNGQKKKIRNIRHCLLKNVANYIAISEEIADNIKKKVSLQTNIIRIPNGVDTNYRFCTLDKEEKIEMRKKLNLSEDQTILLFVGSINKRKGIYDLLEAVKLLESNKNVILILCGPILEDLGFENKMCKINTNKDNVQVIYKGVIKNVNEYMKASDIFILPSYSEGLPNVLLEAAACGLGLVSTDIGGSRDIVVDSETGFLVPTNNPSLLAERIKTLIDNDDLCKEYGRNARKRAMELFSIENVSQAYIDLYNKLCVMYVK